MMAGKLPSWPRRSICGARIAEQGRGKTTTEDAAEPRRPDGLGAGHGIRTGDARLAPRAQAQPGFAIILIPVCRWARKRRAVREASELVGQNGSPTAKSHEFIPPGGRKYSCRGICCGRQPVPMEIMHPVPTRLCPARGRGTDASHAGSVQVDSGPDRITFMEQGHVAPRAPFQFMPRPVQCPQSPKSMPGILPISNHSSVVTCPTRRSGYDNRRPYGNQVLHQGDSSWPSPAPGG